ncbi:MAG TPA: GNAT family N-acetyltransferase [Pirellulaceae bacterium]|jgi:ribosomal protein S18 acetylase RimI-like enzyme
MALTIFLADLNNSEHQRSIIDLLDMYCRDQFGDSKPLSNHARENLIPGLIKHGGARVFLACEEKKPLGVAICMIGFSSFRGKPLINIHDIAVSPEARGQGVGRKLLNAVTDEAKNLGCGKVTLEVRSDNIRAMGLYQSVGFKSSEPETYFWTQTLD